MSFRQSITPEHLLGRMNATMRFLVWGTMPLGAVIGAFIGQYAGVRTALWVSAAGCALSWLPVYFSPLRRMRTLPSAEEPAPVTITG